MRAPTLSPRPTLAVLGLGGAVVLALTGLVALPSHPSAPADPSPKLAAGWQRGVALTDWREGGLASSGAGGAMDDAMRVGADRVVLSPTLYVRDSAADTVAPDPHRTAGDDALRSAIAAARARGLAVTLKPHVDVADGTPRTRIAPTDPDAWMRSYRRALLPYARLAADTHVDTFVVGVELSGLQPLDRQWRDLIAAVREVYAGPLTYAANWDAYDVSWWDALDLIGVDAYMPLTTARDPTDAELAAGWDDVRGRLQGLHDRWHKRVLLTEIGYPDSTGAAAQPYGPTGPPDPQAQAQAVRSAFEALGRAPWLAGAYWWDWPVDESQSSAYSLRGSPAASVLAAYQAPSGGPVRAALVPDAPGPLLALALVGAALAIGGYLVGRRGRRAPDPPAAEPDEFERVLLRTLAAYDAETALHGERVGRLVGAVAAELGLPDDRAQQLRRLGTLHDVGKLRIPLDLLRKPGRLTPEERTVVRRWGAWSAELVAHVPGLQHAAGLLEQACQLDEQTPLDAQLIAACDAYDSMTHRRPFRPAIQRAAVLAALSADRRLDPRIVAAIERHGPRQDPEPPDRRRSWTGDEAAGPTPRRRREDVVAPRVEP